MAHDQTALSEDLWRGFREGLQRFLRARLPSEADAEDVLQEVFLRIHEGAHRLRDAERVHGWIYSIARRAVADFYRARGRRPAALPQPLDTGTETPSPDGLPPENLSGYDGRHDVHEEVLSWLRPMIDELPETYAKALRMADVEGLTQQQVADALGLSLSGAKSRVQRARAQLGELLQRCCEVEFGPEGRAVAFRRLHPEENPCAGDRCD